MRKKLIVTLFLLLVTTTSHAWQLCYPNENSICDLLHSPHRIYIGPEFYYMKRCREDGTTQDGWLIGERMAYERMVPFGIYYGAHQYYAKGCISGKFGCGECLTSSITDAEAEGRIGYTFYNNMLCTFTFTPYVGLGDFHGTNKFISPKRIKKIRFRPSFQYTVFGFFSNFYLCNGSTSFGINVKWKYMNNAENRIEDRSRSCHCKECKKHHHKCGRCDFICILQDMGNRTLYEVDFPLTYHCWSCREQCFEFSIIPFLRNRKYGAKENCPSNFLEETFKMRGARLLLAYIF